MNSANSTRTARPLLATLALVLLFAQSALADVIELRSAELVEGRFLGGTQQTVRVEVAGQTRVIPVADIVAITFDARPPSEQTGETAGQGAAQQGEGTVQQLPPAASTPQPADPGPAANRTAQPAAPKTVTVPAGTPLLIRTRQPLDSNRQGSGHRFTATLEGELRVGSQVVAPRGAPVYGQITSTRRSGRVAGQAEMQLTLTGISINGRITTIVTGPCRAVSENTAGRSAGKVARGAVIGSLANGSRGAKKGAKIGAGAAILTSGNSIYIPSGTLLEFPLTVPLTR